MDVNLAPSTRAALLRAVTIGDTGYPTGTRYAEAFIDFAADRWGWTDLDVARTAIVPDVMAGVVEVLRLITDPGDTVIVTSPVYAPFYAFVAHAHRRVLEAPLGPDGRLDPTVLETTFVAARSQCDNPVLLLSNPHNPTGTVHTRSELEQLALLAERHGIRVISDEIHAPLVLDGATFTPYLTVDRTSGAFAVTSASKAWNLSGLKAALLVAGDDATEDLGRLPEEVSHGPSHLGVLTHTAAYLEGREWLDDLLTGLDENRRLLAELVTEHLPSTRMRRPEGTYLAWLDCRALALHDDSPRGEPPVVTDVAGPAKFFLDHARVALSSGHVFGTGGDGHVRINFATTPTILTEALTRMGQAVALRDSEHEPPPNG
jgi:cystathionine beta-lyase